MVAVRNLYGPTIPAEEQKEAASATYALGACCVLSSGYIDECGADPALVFGLARKAGQNGSSAGDNSAIFTLALPGILYVGNLATSATAGVTAQTDVGTAYGIAKETTDNTWYVDSGDTSNTRVMVWNLFLQDGEALGDTRGRVYFTFDPTYCQGIKI
jgi:hypothetical protein